ncbi:AraC family transcriptional regulator ligand-binding domain-containing protein [Novosphingobium sp. BL-8H]|uniref:AraC family transcriptional regulator n=1 Tax=Novosphingobium sp. BL-8H TaxID=3127640 RepID=UPI0037564F17
MADSDPLPRAMPEPASEKLQARLLRHFPRLVRSLGGDPASLLAAVGLDAAACDRAGAATCHQWVALLERAAVVLGKPDFGLLLACEQGDSDVFGPLGAVMRNSRTLGDALKYVATHNAAHSLAVRVWMGRSASGAHVFMGHDLLGEELPNRSQAIEQALLAGHLGAVGLTGGRARVRRVHFRHEALSPRATYRRHFGCDVHFCQNEDGVVFSLDDLAQPIVAADADALGDVVGHVNRHFDRKRPPFHAQVRGVIMQLLWTGNCANEDVARELGLHPRTLHRRLHEENCAFQAIKDEVRRDFMLYYLRQTDMRFSRISEKLGFAEQSVMSRFARVAFGASPREIRRHRDIAPDHRTAH